MNHIAVISYLRNSFKRLVRASTLANRRAAMRRGFLAASYFVWNDASRHSVAVRGWTGRWRGSLSSCSDTQA